MYVPKIQEAHEIFLTTLTSMKSQMLPDQSPIGPERKSILEKLGSAEEKHQFAIEQAIKIYDHHESIEKLNQFLLNRHVSTPHRAKINLF